MKRSLFFLLLGLMSSSVASATTCEPTTIGSPSLDSLWVYPGTVDSASVKLGSDVPPDPFLIVTAGFDFPRGKLFGYGNCYDFLVEGWDTYEIQGLPGRVPVPITITLSCEVFGSCPPGTSCNHPPVFYLSLQASSGERDSSYFCASAQPGPHGGLRCEEVLRIDLTPTAGEDFSVRYRLSGGNTTVCGQSEVYAQIGFTGIPQGATLVSTCRPGDLSVPTRQSTWGSLKASYR